MLMVRDGRMCEYTLSHTSLTYYTPFIHSLIFDLSPSQHILSHHLYLSHPSLPSLPPPPPSSPLLSPPHSSPPPPLSETAGASDTAMTHPFKARPMPATTHVPETVVNTDTQPLQVNPSTNPTTLPQTPMYYVLLFEVEEAVSTYTYPSFPLSGLRVEREQRTSDLSRTGHPAEITITSLSNHLSHLSYLFLPSF